MDADAGKQRGKAKRRLHDDGVGMDWLTKGSMIPIRAAILSCALGLISSSSARGLPMVKLRKRSSRIFSLSKP